MPLIALAYLSFAAGLLAGFSGALVPGLLASGLLALECLRRANTAWLGAVLTGTAGLLLATSVELADEACAARLPAARQWTVRLAASAAPGAFVRGDMASPGCVGRVSMAVTRGSGEAGAVVTVTGRGTAGDRGLVVQRAVLTPVAAPGLASRLKTAAGIAIDSAFRSDAPMARALLIADSRSIAPEVRDRYASAGLVHMLSISGLHVAIIAGAMLLAFRAVRLTPHAAAVAAVVATALYVIVIGAPAPAVRSGVMLAVGAASRLAQRPTSPWAALALGAFVPLADPRTMLDLGYQLSVAGMAGLVAAGTLSRRVLAPRLDGWRLAVGRDLTTSIVAALVTAPLVAWTFGRVSIISPLTNLVAAPVMTALQPLLFLAMLCAPAPTVARFVADAAHPLLRLFDAIATAGAAAPYGALDVAPTFSAAVAGCLVTSAFVVACVSRFPTRPALLAGGGLVVLLWLPLVPAGTGAVEFHAIDVGQGDAIALRSNRGRWVLIDAGRAWKGGDAGRSTVIPYLRRRGGEVAMFILTHPHADHAGGAASVIRALGPPRYRDAAFVAAAGPYRESLEAARSARVDWRRVRPGETVAVDGLTLEFLAPDSAWTASLDDPNEASTVVRARYGAVQFLLVGDAEAGEERWLLDNAPDLSADVLKVGHHGSRTSSTPEFLDAVGAKLAVISVGAGNRYGHPDAGVIAALAERGASVLRTDQLGSIIVRTDGRTLTIEADGDTWPLSKDSLRH